MTSVPSSVRTCRSASPAGRRSAPAVATSWPPSSVAVRTTGCSRSATASSPRLPCSASSTSSGSGDERPEVPAGTPERPRQRGRSRPRPLPHQRPAGRSAGTASATGSAAGGRQRTRRRRRDRLRLRSDHRVPRSQRVGSRRPVGEALQRGHVPLREARHRPRPRSPPRRLAPLLGDRGWVAQASVAFAKVSVSLPGMMRATISSPDSRTAGTHIVCWMPTRLIRPPIRAGAIRKVA